MIFLLLLAIGLVAGLAAKILATVLGVSALLPLLITEPVAFLLARGVIRSAIVARAHRILTGPSYRRINRLEREHGFPLTRRGR